MARVSGMRSRQTVPRPGSDSTSMVPPMASMLVLTTSIPTPRPETLVTAAAVENPGRKIICRTSCGPIRDSWSAGTRPRSTALAPMRAGSMPAPSSATSTTTWPLSRRARPGRRPSADLPAPRRRRGPPAAWPARRVSRPAADLPAARRRSGASMPWSTELRTRWVSGSLTASSSVLSSSVSLPSISRRTVLPTWMPRSRTTRGSLDQMGAIGCSRLFMTPSWRPARRRRGVARREAGVGEAGRELGPDVVDRLHARLHDALLQLAGDEVEPLGGAHQVGVGRAAHVLDDLVAGEHQLADQQHQRVEQVDVHADGRVGHAAARLLAALPVGARGRAGARR